MQFFSQEILHLFEKKVEYKRKIETTTKVVNTYIHTQNSKYILHTGCYGQKIPLEQWKLLFKHFRKINFIKHKRKYLILAHKHRYMYISIKRTKIWPTIYMY